MKENDPIPRIERLDNPQKKSPCSNFLKQFLPQISMEPTAQLRSPQKRRKNRDEDNDEAQERER